MLWYCHCRRWTRGRGTHLVISTPWYRSGHRCFHLSHFSCSFPRKFSLIVLLVGCKNRAHFVSWPADINHYHHKCLVASEGRSIMPASWPLWTASPLLDGGAIGVLVEWIQPSVHWIFYLKCPELAGGIEVCTWHLRAWWAGTLSGSLTMWPNVAVHCQAVWSANGQRHNGGHKRHTKSGCRLFC